MRENCSKMKILKAMMAGCLLFNNFSGLGLIINAAAIAQSGINSVLDTNVNEEDNAVDNNISVDDSVGGNDSEEVTPILPGDGTIEGDSNDPQKPEVDQPVEGDVPSEDEQPEVPEVEVPSEGEQPEGPEVETSSDEEQSEDNLEVDEVELEEELLSIKNRSIGSGLVQLWQEVEPGQKWKEGATDAEILSALQCRPNHILEPLEGGRATHETYVNSCYVDDALYLGEDNNYYFIYVSGYEGKVAKRKAHTFSADLNGDKTSVDYQINTVAYFIPAATTYSIDSDLNIASEEDLQDTTILEYSDQFLDKGFVEELLDTEINLLSDDSSVESRSWVVKSPSYYANVNGTLYHYLTNNVRSTTYQSTIVGKAPEWMKFNTRYYSYDGIYFYYNWQDIQVDGTGAINNREPFYNYYQYLPFRSRTNYSANIFDTYVKSLGYSTIPQAQSQQDQDKGLPLNLKNTDSKLVNTGNYFYSVQDNYGINAGLQFSIGIHESGSGRSRLSVNKNNIFGMNATDNNPYGNGTSFPSVEAGINYHADRYLSWGYTDPIDDWRYFGSHVGNKGSGMNVNYASDPFWGEKIAGWYYRFDKASGLKDYDYYTIGIKQSNIVMDVKTQANASSSTLYQTKNKKSNIKIAQYPFLIIGEQNGFYKIQTDTPIVNGKPQFSAQYIWGNSTGYIQKDGIMISNSGISEVHNLVANLEEMVIVGDSVVLSGWSIVEGINSTNKEDCPTNLFITDNNSNKVSSMIKVERTYRPDVTSVMGNGIYNYDYAGFTAEIPISQLDLLNVGNYELRLQTDISEKLKTKLTNVITTVTSNPILGNNIFKLYSGSNSEARINVAYYVQNGYIDNPKIDNNFIQLQGWANVEGIETKTIDDSSKILIVKTQDGQEKLRIEASSEYRPDVTNVMGLGQYNYDYSGYNFKLDSDLIGLLEDGVYIIDIFDCYLNKNIKAPTIPASITLVQGNISGVSIEVAVSDQIYLKLQRQALTNLEQISIDENSVFLSGWALLKGIDSTDYINKIMILDSSSNQIIFSQEIEKVNRPDVTEAFKGDGINYSSSGFTVKIPRTIFSQLYGKYEVIFEFNTSQIDKKIALSSSVEETNFIENNIVTFKKNNITDSLDLYITSPILNGYIENPKYREDGIILSGWANIEGINLDEANIDSKLILIKDINSNEVMRWYGEAQYRPDVTLAMGNQKYNYDYSGYEYIIDYDKLLLLPEGQYIIDVYSQFGNTYVKAKTLPTENNLLSVIIDNKIIEVAVSDQIYLKVTIKK